MRDVITVYRKELKSYLVSPIPYVFFMVFTGFLAWRFFMHGDGVFFVRSRATLEIGLFDIMPWVLVFLVPAISMRLWSEEVRNGTIEQLMTLPVKTTSLVLGKFFSALTLVLFALILTLPIAITVSTLGDLDWGPVWGGYLGALLYSGAILALGLWISALTGHQIVAFLITLVIGVGLILLGWVGGTSSSGVSAILHQLSTSTHYEPMGRGVIDLRDLAYLLSFIGLFLYLNVQAVENRRVS